MNGRKRRQPPRRDFPAYLLYLKPGALAQLRDSRISAAHRTRPPIHDGKPVQICSPPRSAAPSQIDGPPSHRRIYGPRCPQRKKLMAAKGFLHSGPDLTGHVSEPASIVDLFSGSDSAVLVVAQ